MKLWLAVLLLCAACSASTSGPTPVPTPVVDTGTMTAINTGVAAVVSLGCTFIPSNERPGVLAGLAIAAQLAKTSPADAYNQLIDLAKVNSGVAWIWSAFHTVLDPIAKLTSQSWVAYAQEATLTAIQSCESGIGAVPS